MKNASLEEKDYRLLFENLGEAFVVYEGVRDKDDELIDLRFLKINAYGVASLGKKPEEVIGKLRSAGIGEMEGSFIDMIKRVINQQEVVRQERYFPEIDKWLDTFAYSPQPNWIAFLLIDFSDRKTYEKNLKKLNDDLKRKANIRTAELAESLEREKKLNGIQRSFLTMAAHELKTPLASIKLSVNLLNKYLDQPDRNEQEKYHGYIQQEAENMLKLLDDFVKPANQEIGKAQLENKSFNLLNFTHQLLEELNEMCKPRQTINLQYVGAPTVCLDARILRRVLLNLLSNAIKYSDQEINFEVEVKKKKVLIKVADQGIGIPKSEQDKIFSQYFRAKNALKTDGTGLGLNIVKNYVNLMEGTIKFTSKENVGTTFTIILPLEVA